MRMSRDSLLSYVTSFVRNFERHVVQSPQLRCRVLLIEYPALMPSPETHHRPTVYRSRQRDALTLDQLTTRYGRLEH
jgi:hypothetical protein